MTIFHSCTTYQSINGNWFVYNSISCTFFPEELFNTTCSTLFKIP